ncbi:hypothetical protein [Pseudomonas ficuserectae]|uniref:hypothetical protein n=1 Tax=Pseudomonas ficuserectae TaxID=53410 RepID=UPI00211C8A50|nr:hypothetical protein [Pseudomonas ficuserectae]
MTDRLLTALSNTAKSNKNIVPSSIISSLKITAKEAISSIKLFNPEHPENLLTAMFGELHSDEKILSSFTKELKKQKISASIIKIPENYYPKSTKKIKETYEGVKIIYTQEHVDSGDIEFDDSDSTKKIIVSTLQYIVDDEFNGRL